MKELFTKTNIPNLQESIQQFFSYHEKVKNLESELSKIDAELFLCEQLIRALKKTDPNPFEVE